MLAPGWTDYSKRLLYQTYDVTDLLVEGENVIGAIVADGWACGFSASTASDRVPTTHETRSSWPNLWCGPLTSVLRVATDQAWTSSTGASFMPTC